MKEFFDSSVLVAAFLGDHPHHQASVKAFRSANKKQSACAAHSLAEVYLTLTSLPLKPMITPAQAMLFMADVRARVTAVALDDTEYYTVLEQLVEQGVSGGRVYDALLLQCAVKVRAQTIYTWNLKHFQHLRPEIAERIKTP